MSKIIEVKNNVISFLKDNCGVDDVRVIKLEKNDEVWKSIAEVYEDDSFLKSMNLPVKKTRVFYSVVIDNQNEVISYNRLTTYDESEIE